MQNFKFPAITALFASFVLSQSCVHADDATQAVVTTHPPIEVKAGIQSMSGHGAGPSAAVSIRPQGSTRAYDRGDPDSGVAIGVDQGVRVQASAQSGADQAGARELTQASAGVEAFSGGMFSSQADHAGKNVGVQGSAGVGVDRNVGLTRIWDAHARGVLALDFGTEKTGFRLAALGQAGARDSNNNTLHYIQLGGSLSAQLCPLGDADHRNRLCIDGDAALAVGLAATHSGDSGQTEVLLKAAAEVQHWSSDRQFKIYTGPEVQAGSSSDAGGKQSFTQSGWVAGMAF